MSSRNRLLVLMLAVLPGTAFAGSHAYGSLITQCRISGFTLICSGNGIEITAPLDGCLNRQSLPIEVKVDGASFRMFPSCEHHFTSELWTEKDNCVVVTGMCGSTGLPRLFEVFLRGNEGVKTCLPLLCQP